MWALDLFLRSWHGPLNLTVNATNFIEIFYNETEEEIKKNILGFNWYGTIFLLNSIGKKTKY